MSRAVVLGAGSWGTAFAKVLAEAGAEVSIWARRERIADSIREHGFNHEYLPSVKLPRRVTATTDAAEAIDGAELVVLAVPSQTLRGNLADWAGLLAPDSTLISLMKGIELGTTKRMSQVIVETAGVSADRVVVVSGPNLAPEIAAEQPAATVVACSDMDRATLVQNAITVPYLRPYTNDDVVGCELGGAVKNVIALAYGMASALRFGDNTKAMLITRGLAETARLGVALGADPMTFAGLAGLGDLVATCCSPHSRNRRAGLLLARGVPPSELEQRIGMVVEGVATAPTLQRIGRERGLDLPLTERVCAALEGESPAEAVELLLAREPGEEF
jgi:glycerol-3-phosphate dehydrogenase (NAD(P)+)